MLFKPLISLIVINLRNKWALDTFVDRTGKADRPKLFIPKEEVDLINLLIDNRFESATTN